MTGPRPQHLYRRGAIYAVRFRIPSDLISHLGSKEFARSLLTSDPVLARARCRDMTVWFKETMVALRLTSSPTRADLDAAASRHLAFLERDAQRPGPPLPLDGRNFAVTEYIQGWRERRLQVVQQLQDRDYDAHINRAANLIARQAGAALDALSKDDQRYLHLVAARAEVQRIDCIIASFERPEQPFSFTPVANQLPGNAPSPSLPAMQPSLLMVQSLARVAGSLGSLVPKFLEFRRREAISQSHHDEMKRALDWLVEALGADTDASIVTPEALREVRDGFQRFDKRLQGRARSFSERQVPNPEHWIAPQTSSRYWHTVQAFFRWLRDEKYILADPADGLRRPAGTYRPPATPDPLSNEEVQQFSGHLCSQATRRTADVLDRVPLLRGIAIGGRQS